MKSFSQQVAPVLKKLAQWWRLFRRGNAVKEIARIVQNADMEIIARQEGLALEKSQHIATQEQLKQSNSELKLVATKLGLITSILGAENKEHPKYQAFSKFLDAFKAFAHEERLHDDDAANLGHLQTVAEELRLLGHVPLFREKAIIAVAGGFSSGKSSLITSFLDERHDINLPIGMDPVTAIPCYIVVGAQASVRGFPAHGGEFAISPELFAQMRHDFIASLGFDLRRILPFVVLETPWRKDWQHLCFIDTPGYNAPAISGITSVDTQTTAAALEKANALLWVIGLDANGEIAAEDLRFLEDYCKDLPLAVVVNKADQRPINQVTAVMEKIRDTLDTYGIQYESISAYSSVECREYAYIEKELEQFLEQWNHPYFKRDDELKERTLKVLDQYDQAFAKEKNERRKNSRLLQSLRLDLNELGLFDEQEENGNVENKDKKWSLAQVADRILSERPSKVKDDAQERLSKLSTLFAIGDIEQHRTKLKMPRTMAKEVFAMPWEQADNS